MRYRDVFQALEMMARHDAALAITLGRDAWSDRSGEMGKTCARQAFTAARRVQGLREWLACGKFAPSVDAPIDYVAPIAVKVLVTGRSLLVSR